MKPYLGFHLLIFVYFTSKIFFAFINSIFLPRMSDVIPLESFRDNLLAENYGKMYISNLKRLYYEEVASRWFVLATDIESKIKLIPHEVASGIRNEYLIWPIGKIVIQRCEGQFCYRSDLTAERFFDEEKLKNHLKTFLFDSEIQGVYEELRLQTPKNNSSLKWMNENLKRDDLGNPRTIIPFWKEKIAEELAFRVETFEDDEFFELTVILSTSLARHTYDLCFDNQPILDFCCPIPVEEGDFDLNLQNDFLLP